MTSADPEVWQEQAANIGYYNAAIIVMRNSSSIGGDNGARDFKLGQYYLRLGHIAVAEAAFSRAVQFDPTRHDALMGLGQAACARADFSGALSFFEEAGRAGEAAAPNATLDSLIAGVRPLASAQAAAAALPNGTCLLFSGSGLGDGDDSSPPRYRTWAKPIIPMLSRLGAFLRH